jgi:predicted branched-subunit amino acid permease
MRDDGGVRPREAPTGTVRAGVRAGLPFAVAGALVAIAFGVLARDVGLSPLATIAMSAIVFAGGGQFAALAVLLQGGTIAAAVLAAALMNARYLPMGVAVAPALRGRWPWRAAQGQAVVDVSWALSARGDGTFDRRLLLGVAVVQYVLWVGGTIAGALGGELLGDPRALGLDALFPAFFAALLIGELRDRARVAVALAAAAVALALVPVVPPGVPLLVAAAVALVGVRQPAPSPSPAREDGPA